MLNSLHIIWVFQEAIKLTLSRSKKKSYVRKENTASTLWWFSFHLTQLSNSRTFSFSLTFLRFSSICNSIWDIWYFLASFDSFFFHSNDHPVIRHFHIYCALLQFMELLETGCNQLSTIHRIESTWKHIGGTRGKSGARVMAIIDHLRIQNKGKIYLMCCLTEVIKSNGVIF